MTLPSTLVRELRRRRRHELRISQRALAARIGIGNSTLSRRERRKDKPSIDGFCA